MVTKPELRKIKRRVAQPKYPLDHELLVAASEASDDIYGTILNPATHIIYRYLSELVIEIMKYQTGQPINKIRILDWGCGKGYVQYFLSRKGAKTEGFETSGYPHKAIWNKFDLKVKTSKGDKLPFQKGTFDAIVGFGVLEHVLFEHEALKELNRVLKPTGLFFCFNLPNKFGYMHKIAWWRGIRYHDRLYSRKEIKHLLKRAGFNTVGKPWYRQLFPKGYIKYSRPVFMEKIDLFLTNYTPFRYFATSLEFVARKQFTYLSVH
ncbi:MAG TPA: class I SAM-dependent methyltransferase [Candidatus Saccharimonadales bacterium]|nr:class I SAM-dependent methyltransferase [Candidatus Saccharimonadales bacterium]